MTTKTDYKPCPRSWGDGYTAGYRQAIRDAEKSISDPVYTQAMVENFTWESHGNYVQAYRILDGAKQAIRALAPREEE